MSDTPRTVPLDDRHREHGAEMTEFNGFSMPVRYEGVTEEHLAVRNNVGLFDVSHMGEVEIRGPDAVETVNRLVTNDAGKLSDGRAQYTALCDESGGIVDDLVYYRLAADRVLAIVNAGNRQKDFEHMARHAGEGDAELVNRSDDCVLLALQGPNAEAVLSTCTSLDLEEIGFFGAATGEVAGADALVSRTGYTGEDGFEICAEAEDAVPLFDALVDAGDEHDMQICGLGARDTLRLEAMLNLYGQDMDEENNPFEARLGWTVSLDKDVDFVGRDALERIADEGPERKLRGFVLNGRGVIRSGYDIYVDDQPVGTITSGSYAPSLEESIGLGYVDIGFADVDEVEIELRGRRVAAATTDEPFYER